MLPTQTASALLPIHVIRTEHELIRFEGRFITKADQLLVMRIGKAPEENAVDHAEDRRGRPNPQCKSEDRNQRETRAIPQVSESKSQVLKERVEKGDAALFAVQLFGLFDASEFTPRGIARFHRTHAAPNVFLREHFQVRAKLCIKVHVQLPLAE